MKNRTKLPAAVAITLRPWPVDGDVASHWMWSGWKRHHWPADVVRPGLRLLAFDTKGRAFRHLLRVKRGGAFTYRSWSDFSAAVKRVTGWAPRKDDAYRSRMPDAQPGARCTGVAMRWELERDVNIPWSGRFPRIGWLKLNEDVLAEMGPDQFFAEGGRRLRAHMRVERSSTLRSRAKEHWRDKLVRLRCLACGFDFKRFYGALGWDFIEMHHDVPLASTGKVSLRPSQLTPLCANCHRMIHRGETVLSVSQLRRLVRTRSRRRGACMTTGRASRI